MYEDEFDEMISLLRDFLTKYGKKIIDDSFFFCNEEYDGYGDIDEVYCFTLAENDENEPLGEHKKFDLDDKHFITFDYFKNVIQAYIFRRINR